MTKKDFIAIADAIRYHHEFELYETFTDVQLNVLCEAFRKINPRFDRDRWLGYISGECGANGGAIKNR